MQNILNPGLANHTNIVNDYQEIPPNNTEKPVESEGHPQNIVPEGNIDPRWFLGVPFEISISTRNVPTIVAIGGGKGGIGKSFISANLAARIAEFGKKVLLIDLDVGGANLHTHFGLRFPKKTLGNLLYKKGVCFKDLPIDTKIPNLKLIAGHREDIWGTISSLNRESFYSLWQGILKSRDEQKVDYVFVDLGAGVQNYTTSFFGAAHFGLVVIVPEPTAIENAYMFLKSVFWHLVTNVGHRLGIESGLIESMKELSLNRNEKNQQLEIDGYVKRLKKLDDRFTDFVTNIFRAFNGRTVCLVLNQIRSFRELEIGRSMELIASKYFGFEIKFLGSLAHDDLVWKSIANRRLLVNDFPESGIAKNLTEIALKLKR